MALFKFVHPRAMEYTQPAFTAEPGKEYDLDEAPDALHWKPVRKSSDKPAAPANERK